MGASSFRVLSLVLFFSVVTKRKPLFLFVFSWWGESLFEAMECVEICLRQAVLT